MDHKRKKSPKDARRNRKETKSKMAALAREESGVSRGKLEPNQSFEQLSTNKPAFNESKPASVAKPHVRRVRPSTKTAGEETSDLLPVIGDEGDAVMPRARLNGVRH